MLASDIGGHSRNAGKMILGVSERIESGLSIRIVVVWRLERINVKGSRKLREHAKLVPSRVNGRDPSRYTCSGWNLLSELEHRWATVFTLLPQAKNGAMM
jgi:hypothetical protein